MRVCSDVLAACMVVFAENGRQAIQQFLQRKKRSTGYASPGATGFRGSASTSAHHQRVRSAATIKSSTAAAAPADGQTPHLPSIRGHLKSR